MPDVTLNLEALDKPFIVTVEPWAAPEFTIRPGERCSVIVHHPNVTPTVTSSVADGNLYINVYEAGSKFSFVCNGRTEFSIPDHLALPQMSGKKS